MKYVLSPLLCFAYLRLVYVFNTKSNTKCYGIRWAYFPLRRLLQYCGKTGAKENAMLGLKAGL